MSSDSAPRRSPSAVTRLVLARPCSAWSLPLRRRSVSPPGCTRALPAPLLHRSKRSMSSSASCGSERRARSAQGAPQAPRPQDRSGHDAPRRHARAVGDAYRATLGCTDASGRLLLRQLRAAVRARRLLRNDAERPDLDAVQRLRGARQGRGRSLQLQRHRPSPDRPRRDGGSPLCGWNAFRAPVSNAWFMAVIPPGHASVQKRKATIVALDANGNALASVEVDPPFGKGPRAAASIPRIFGGRPAGAAHVAAQIALSPSNTARVLVAPAKTGALCWRVATTGSVDVFWRCGITPLSMPAKLTPGGTSTNALGYQQVTAHLSDGSKLGLRGGLGARGRRTRGPQLPGWRTPSSCAPAPASSSSRFPPHHGSRDAGPRPSRRSTRRTTAELPLTPPGASLRVPRRRRRLRARTSLVATPDQLVNARPHSQPRPRLPLDGLCSHVGRLG